MDMPQEPMHKQHARSVLVFSHSHTGAVLQDLFMYFCHELAPEKGDPKATKFHAHGFCYVFASEARFHETRNFFPQMRAGIWDESKKLLEELQPGKAFLARGLHRVQEQVFDGQSKESPMAPKEVPAIRRQEGGGHYKSMKIQPFEYNHANGIPFAEGCIIKYVSRWKAKGGVEDLKKARHFLDLLIEAETKDETKTLGARSE